MQIDRCAIKDAARESIRRASYDPKKLILIHTGCAIGLSVVVMLVNALLSHQMTAAEGLSGMGTLSMLSTLQVVLVYAQIAAILFWQMGYVYATMQISHREYAGPRSLLEGFRRFGPILRLVLLQSLVYFGVIMAASYLAVFLFTFFPQSAALMEVVSVSGELDEAALDVLWRAYPYILSLFALVFIPLFLPLHYGYRMSTFCVMDGKGALAALRESRRMMKGNRMFLFKLDMSFWWFYGLYLLVAILAYGDAILPAIGISLPWSATVSYYIFFALSAILQLTLYWWRKNEVDVTYAHVYACFRRPPEETVIDL